MEERRETESLIPAKTQNSVRGGKEERKKLIKKIRKDLGRKVSNLGKEYDKIIRIPR